MTPKKLDIVAPVKKYIRVEEIDRRSLGILQFEFDLKVYFDSAGRMVVEESEYNAAIARQRSR
jgi:hypothetical protein